MSPFDTRAISRAFGRAATSYSAAAALQHEVEARLLESLAELCPQPPRQVLDLGCGPGSASVAIKARWGRRCEVIGVDLALPMLRQLRSRSRFWRPLHAVQADAQALPFAEGRFDLVFSNLCLQWVADLPQALGELRRVLAEGGLLRFSTFGPDTLIELREAYRDAGLEPPLSPFASLQQVGDALLAMGFRDPVVEREHWTLSYPDLPALLRELKTLGATDARRDRPRGLAGKSRHRAVAEAYRPGLENGRLPSTWEVIGALAFAPPSGTPRRQAGIEIASFPAERLPIRRRSPAAPG